MAEKQINIKLPAELYRRLRMTAADLDLSMQEFVVRLLERETNEYQRLKKKGNETR